MPATRRKKPKIFIISLGCPRNLVDSEILLGDLKKKGFRIIERPAAGSVAIVNTCAFIEDAKTESIDIILELAGLRKVGKINALIVAGCLSQRYGKQLAKDIKEIDGIFGTGSILKIPQYLKKISENKTFSVVKKIPDFLYDHTMPRMLLTPRHSVYVKIQEGCMNFCSYCVIPKIRGPFRSRGIRSILKESSSLVKHGAKEINLIGQDTTLYGKDRYKKLMLSALLRKLARVMKAGWVRVLYTHPAHYTEELLDVIKSENSICRYLDLPIQHINDKILKKMNRHVTKKSIITLIDTLRKEIPGIAIRTSVIVGFPGEGKKEFEELKDFIKETKFERLGAFIYSREEGTKAYSFSRQVTDAEKEGRLDEIMEVQKRISEESNKNFLGKILKVLIDEKSPHPGGPYLGRTEYDAPEVDGTVHVKSKRPLKAGDFVNVRINDVLEYDLVGNEGEAW